MKEAAEGREILDYDGVAVYEQFSEAPTEEVVGFLDGEIETVGVVALDDVKVARNGDEFRLQSGDYWRGLPDYLDGTAVVLNGDIFEDGLDIVPRDQRNDGGFYTTNGDTAPVPEGRNSPVELKTRFPHELRAYPEMMHTHNVPEYYFANGKFRMKVGGSRFPNVVEELEEELEGLDSQNPNALIHEHPEYFRDIELEDEGFVVPPGLYHAIWEREEDGYLVVARGDPSGEDFWVGKWDLEGNQFYDHFPEEPDFPELTTY